MIETLPFGRTGHRSTRILFGAAALSAMRQERADRVLALLREHGINHIDAAASYGDAELRLAPWMRKHRDEFFLATKTGSRTADGARASLERSRQRMGVDTIDLVQLHNLVDPDGWETAMGPGGALEALVEARDRGHVRFIGVTGHGTRAAEMHLRSLERFPFHAVLVPYNFPMLQAREYVADFETLLAVCAERGVAVQTIKSVARRRWPEGVAPRFSWYEPLTQPEDVARAVRWVLGRPGIFLNSSSDARLLPATLAAASGPGARPTDAEMTELVTRETMKPLFVRGVAEGV